MSFHSLVSHGYEASLDDGSVNYRVSLFSVFICLTTAPKNTILSKHLLY